MVDINEILNQSNPHFFLKKIADNLKSQRIQKNLTQKELSERSGVSLASLRNFEQKGEIALQRLVQLAIALDATEGLSELFAPQKHETLNEFLNSNINKKRQKLRKR